MTEQWKSIEGWEGLYEVSTEGRVRSLDRPYHVGKILLGSEAGDGYRKVILSDKPRYEHAYVHRLVLKAFVGPCPESMEACHANAKRDDNRLENLRWDTSSANNADIVASGNHYSANKSHCPRGHALTWPNLVASELSQGRRKCKACNRARAHAQRNGSEMFEQVSDACYRSVMAEVS